MASVNDMNDDYQTTILQLISKLKQSTSENEAKDREILLLSQEVEAHRVIVETKDRHILDIEARNVELVSKLWEHESNLKQSEKCPDKVSSSLSTSRLYAAQQVAKAAPTSTKEMSALSVELAKERLKYFELKDQHNDLLALLAQFDVEVRTIREALGTFQLAIAEKQIRAECKAKYGRFIDHRSAAATQISERDPQESNGRQRA